MKSFHLTARNLARLLYYYRTSLFYAFHFKLAQVMKLYCKGWDPEPLEECLGAFHIGGFPVGPDFLPGLPLYIA